jgi:hypothetical protein
MAMKRKSVWTFCETNEPKYIDLVHLSQTINYHKRRMMTIIAEPYKNGYDDDNAETAVEVHTEAIEDLSDEYSEMLAFLGLKGRVG